VRNTMVHVLSAEWGWLERCGGPPRGAQLSADDYPSVAALAAAWAAVEADVRGFLDTLRDDDLGRLVEFVIPRGGERRSVAGGQLLAAARHPGVPHRGPGGAPTPTLGSP